MVKKVIKKVIPFIIILAVVFALLHFIPITKNMDIKMEGTVRNADGEVLAPCFVELDGKERRYLFGKKGDALEGSIELTGDFETIFSHMIHLGIFTFPEKAPDGAANPFKNLVYYTGSRYDEKTNSTVIFHIYSTADRAAHIIVDKGTVYCFTRLEESAFLEFFELVKQFATNDLALNPNPQ